MRDTRLAAEVNILIDTGTHGRVRDLVGTLSDDEMRDTRLAAEVNILRHGDTRESARIVTLLRVTYILQSKARYNT